MAEKKHRVFSRRGFVNWLLGLSAFAWAGSVAFPILRYLKPLEHAGPGGPTVLSLEELARLAAERFVIVRSGTTRLLVFRDAKDELRALDAKCTHEGCTVRWLADESLVNCACHDARFDVDGRVISGPPPRPLREHDVRIGEDESVTVTLRSV